MKIEILENVKHERELYAEGDVRTVTAELGAYFCACGWARDVDGVVETGDRDLAPKVVAPDGAKHGHKAQEV